MEFLKKYNNPKNLRFNSFKFALIEAQKRNHKTLVETGVARGKRKFFFFFKNKLERWNEHNDFFRLCTIYKWYLNFL